METFTATAAYQKLDATWTHRVHRSGWQGWTLLAGGEDVMDQSLLFWEEGKGPHRTLNLNLRLRRDSDRKVRDRLSALGGMEIYRGTVPYPRKQVVAGEIHPLDRHWELVAGTALDVQIDAAVRLRYFPYESEVTDWENSPFSAQGSLTLVRERAHGQVDEVAGMLLILSSLLGMDTRLSTAADLEYLYLRKTAWAMSLEGADLDAVLAEVADEPVECRVTGLRAWMSRQLQVAAVSQLERYDWRPHFGSAYNPWGSAVGSGAGGWPHWYRFDMERALAGPLRRTYLGHNLASHAPAIGDRIARIVRSTGYLLSSEERWMRLGTPSLSIYLPDTQSGGGAYLPMRLLEDFTQATLVFTPELLRRCDHIAVARDGGAEALSPHAVAARLRLEAIEEVPSCDVYFKRGISLLDSLVRVNLDHEVDRVKVLDAFRNVGVRKIRGVPVDEVVCLRYPAASSNGNGRSKRGLRASSNLTP